MPERPFTRDQAYLLPPSLDEWVAADHPVRFVDAFVAHLPTSTRHALGFDTPAQARGAARYSPVLLASVWIYGFMSRRRSSRMLECACRDEVPLRWLTGNQVPDHNTLWRWYVAHRSAMRALLAASVETAVEAGLVDLAVLAVDGTKVVANATVNRSLTAEELAALLATTEQAIADLEAQNVEGGDPPPPSLPGALRQAVGLRERVQQAMAQCAERAAATGTAASTSTPRGNVTDPDARWMKTRTGIVPGYNAQVAVVATNARARTILGRSAPEGRIVVAAEVSTHPHDAALLATMVREAIATLGVAPGVTVADAGYFAGESLAAVATMGTTAVVSESVPKAARSPYHRLAFTSDAGTDRLRCPEQHWLVFQRSEVMAGGVASRRYGGLRKICATCPAFGSCTTDRHNGRQVRLSVYDEAIQAQRRIRAFAPHVIVRRRKALVEAVFGTIKTTLAGGRTMVRGRARVAAEWQLLAVAMNLRTLCRIWTALPADRRWHVLPSPALGQTPVAGVCTTRRRRSGSPEKYAR